MPCDNVRPSAKSADRLTMDAGKFFAELKRRRVYKVAIAYAVGGWALAQGIAQVFPVFNVANWVVRFIVLLIVLGFPVALVLSWFFDLTRYGIVRTPDAEPASKVDAIQTARPPEKSIAVLPFDNQNRDPDTDYLSDGIPESIIHSLSQLPNLKVMSRNSVFHYKGKDTNAQAVAKELKVQAVLTGRMTQRGEGLSISVELIKAQDNSQIWGQQYNRKLADVFAIQEEIAKEISEKLRLKLSGAERQQLAKRPTENLKAFQYYMQGR